METGEMLPHEEILRLVRYREKLNEELLEKTLREKKAGKISYEEAISRLEMIEKERSENKRILARVVDKINAIIEDKKVHK